MSDPKQIYTQESTPSPYGAPQPQAPFNNYDAPPVSYNTHPLADGQSPTQYSSDKQTMNIQQPQATYQQQQPQGPSVMSYNQPHNGMSPPPAGYDEKGTPVSQGYPSNPPVNQAQPMPQRGMDPNGPGGPPRDPSQYDTNGERSWSHDLMDCFGDCGTCCFAYFCPCMVYQQVKNRLDHLRLNGRPDPKQGGSGCGGDCCLYGTLTGCCGIGWVLQMSTRATMRARYRIRGDGCTDCMASCCCIPCELTQESRELEVEEGYIR